jgi:hypothetical protein
MNVIPLEQGRIIAERLLEQAIIRLDIANNTPDVVCTVVGLSLIC